MPSLRHRRGTASSWTAANPILSDGEIGYERDTGRFKMGDGAQSWAELDYFIPEPAIAQMITSALADLGATDTTALSEQITAVESELGSQIQALTSALDAKADDIDLAAKVSKPPTGVYTQFLRFSSSINDARLLSDTTTASVLWITTYSGRPANAVTQDQQRIVL